jgi:hypothetical protein
VRFGVVPNSHAVGSHRPVVTPIEASGQAESCARLPLGEVPRLCAFFPLASASLPVRRF